MGEQYALALAKYMPSWMGIAAFGIIFIGSVIGANLGGKCLRNTLRERVSFNGRV